MPVTDAPKLTFRDKDLEHRVEQTILRNVKDAVIGASEKDELCMLYNEQLQGITSPPFDVRWNGACDLDDPLSRDAHTTIQAQTMQALKHDPPVMVEATDPADEDNAALQEAFIPRKLYEAGSKRVMPEVAYNAGRYQVSILYCGWHERIRPERSVKYRREGQEDYDDLVTEEEKEPGVAYEPVYLTQPGAVEYAGLELRAVDTGDFYLYPANKKSIPAATGCGERLMLSRHDLLMGIKDYGFDEEKVHDLLLRGPVASDGGESADRKERDDDYSGTEAQLTDSRDGDYECFLWFTRLPYLMNEKGESELPEEWLTEDVMCVVCPAAGVVLSMDFSPYRSDRPYIPFYYWPVPNQFYGDSLMQILNALQSEANANLRFGIDSMNLQISPAWKRVMGTERYNQDAFTMFPGAVMWVGKMEDAAPIEMPVTWKETLILQNDLRNQAKELYSAGGWGQQQQKVRKSAEVQQVQMSAASKFDLLLTNFLMGYELLAVRVIALYAEHMNDTGEEFLDLADHKQKISPRQLRGRYLYKPTATSQNADPVMRIEMGKEVKALVDEYAIMEAKGLPPQLLKRLWHIRRTLLTDYGIHNPEAYIGEEPKEQPQAGGMNPMMMMQQAALQGQMMPGGGNGQQSVPPSAAGGF